MRIVLVECDLTSPADVAVTLRFADRAIWPMSPDDADRPGAVWDERVMEPPSLRRELFSDLQSLEPGLGVGVLTLANADRGLDPYQGHVWGAVRVWSWTYGAPFSEARALITGRAAATPAYDRHADRPGRVRLTLFDQRLELEQPIQTATYGGTNDDETVFWDGDEATRGKLKPLAFGRLDGAHVPAVLVNRAKQGYQYHDGPIQGSVEMFDRGVDPELTDGGDTSTLADVWFDETLDSSSHYYTRHRDGLIKFNGSLVGTIAYGLRGDATGGYVETPGPLARRVLERGGIDAGSLGASLAVLDSDHVAGWYADEPTSVREVLRAVAAAAPAAILPDRSGVWQATALNPPEETAVLTLTGADILGIEADDSAVTGVGEVRVGYDRIWTTYRREALLPELLGTTEETRLSTEWRHATAEDAGIKARMPGAWKTLRVDTALRLEADAQALADHLMTLFGLRSDGRPRRRWRMTIEMTDAVLDTPLGATVAVSAPELGLNDHYLLIGEEPLRPRRDQIIWTVWG